ncbi:uncharacterized protein [Nicotiana tomentosiformis]|uniref:uncharacterized protein n=1 Tax=Nicotiana tomentosiformis TaxID=4098 RepID=UPI00388C822F
MVEKGCNAYLAFMRDVSVNTPRVELVPVVRDYPDIFLADLSGMLPDRDIDFEGFLSIAAPMIRLNQEDALFRWTEEYDGSFEKPKTDLSTVLVLVLPVGSGSSTVYCDASHISLGAVLMQDGMVIAYASRQLKRRWLKLLKDYDITILYHPVKENVVVDSLICKAENLGSLAYLPVAERPIALNVQALANQFVILDVFYPSRFLACVVSQSSLYDCIRERQYDDPHLLVLKDTVQHGDAKEVTIGGDSVLWMYGRLCVPNVDGLRELIL